MIIIRQAAIEDGPVIKVLLEQLGYPDMTPEQVTDNIKHYSQEGYQLLVIQVSNVLAGFISVHCFEQFHSPGKMGRISAFCIEEQFRSQGIGKQLLQAAEQYFITSGCTKLEVTSNARRHDAHEFYLRQGYLEDSRRFVKYLKSHGKV